jgi:hypothetical protein
LQKQIEEAKESREGEVCPKGYGNVGQIGGRLKDGCGEYYGMAEVVVDVKGVTSGIGWVRVE